MAEKFLHACEIKSRQEAWVVRGYDFDSRAWYNVSVHFTAGAMQDSGSIPDFENVDDTPLGKWRYYYISVHEVVIIRVHVCVQVRISLVPFLMP